MDVKHVITALALLTILALYIRYRNKMLIALCTATAIALAWTSYYRYSYVGDNIFLFDRINVYPFVLWTLGLTILYLVHTHLYKKTSALQKTTVSIILYLTALAVIEVIGYYILDIRLRGNYTSLLGLGIIHAPNYMKIFYVTAGPLYLFLLAIMNRYQKT